jgi:6-phosphofructokinase
MVKRVICFSLGGHISTQNASFKKLAEILGPKGYAFFGAEDGFEAFETGKVYELNYSYIPKDFAGFVAGAGRYSLTNKDGTTDQKKLDKAIEFFKKGKFDIAVGSSGDDHGKQMDTLRKNLEGKVGIYVINKTMDNDLGGKDGEDNGKAPYTDFTNGYHTTVFWGSEFVRQHFAGAWTNNLPYLIGHFGRETNWVGIALAYYGLADKIIHGELPEEHPGHSVEKIHELILESQERNEKKYGRRFAMIIVPEGTRISGIEHTSSDLIDPHGHHKLNPEVLVTHLKEELEKRYKMKTQTAGITYEMRNFIPTPKDIEFAEDSADAIANAILRGESGVESTFKIMGDKIEAGVAPIEKVSQKRYANYYPKSMINQETFEVTDEIGKYYKLLFDARKNLEQILPKKPKVINILQ